MKCSSLSDHRTNSRLFLDSDYTLGSSEAGQDIRDTYLYALPVNAFSANIRRGICDSVLSIMGETMYSNVIQLV